MLSTSAEDQSATDSVCPHYPSPGHCHAPTTPVKHLSPFAGWVSSESKPAANQTNSVQILSNMTSPKISKLLISSISQHFDTNDHLVSAEPLLFLQSFLMREVPMNFLDTETLLL